LNTKNRKASQLILLTYAFVFEAVDGDIGTWIPKDLKYSKYNLKNPASPRFPFDPFNKFKH